MTLSNLASAIPPLVPLSHASLSQLLTPRLGLFVTLVVILVARYVRSPWRKVPPGPKGLPILGNALQLQNKDWMYEKECKRKFGSSNSVFFANSMTLQIYHRTFRTYHVFECPWPAHYRFT
jgi:hypothetical protein